MIYLILPSNSLSKEVINDLPISDEIYENYLGGRGLGVKLLTDRMPARVDPFSPENIMIFATGPFGGTTIPTNGRFSLVTKSPLTGGIFFSNSGGFFGVFMKKCGYDGILIEGVLKKSGYLLIDENNGATIKDASNLWGLDTEDTLEKLKEIEGKDVHVLMIGPAGENLVKIASIMNDAARAFGRGGWSSDGIEKDQGNSCKKG